MTQANPDMLKPEEPISEFDQYVVDTVLRTESNDMQSIRGRLLEPGNIHENLYTPLRRIVNDAAILDKTKKWVFYGKLIDLEDNKDGWYRPETSQETPLNEAIAQLDKPWIIRLLHGLMGIATETGELIKALMLYLFCGKALNETNVIEELGDILWYFGICCSALGVSFSTILDANRKKLRKRFPNKFTEHEAVHRDLAAEERVLDKAIAQNVATGCRRGCPVPHDDDELEPILKRAEVIVHAHPPRPDEHPVPLVDGDEVDSLTAVETALGNKPQESNPLPLVPLQVGEDALMVPPGFLAYYCHQLVLHREEGKLSDPRTYHNFWTVYKGLSERFKQAWEAAAESLMTVRR